MSERRGAGFSMLGTVLAVGLVGAIAGAALAGPFEDAVVAHGRGDYATAERLFRLLAEQGNAAAQFNLGVMYNDGRGVPQNDAEAVKWFRKAADQGAAPAQFNLGNMYNDGRGVPQNDAEAVKCFRKAAGVLQAADALGISQATVKTHLSRLFEKTSTNRQADLVRIVASFATPLITSSARLRQRLWNGSSGKSGRSREGPRA